MHCFKATLQSKTMLLLAPLLLANFAQGYEDAYALPERTGRTLLASTNVTSETLAISVPSACTAGTISSSLDYSCAVACSTSGSLNYTVTQRTTLDVSLVSGSASGSLIIIGGSNTAGLQQDPVTDLTLATTNPPSGSPSWVNASYTGFSYTPKLAKYASCGTSQTTCTFAFYVIDASTLTGTKGKACRFNMNIEIDPMSLPAITASQLYNVNAAPMAAAKAPLALLALLAVPLLFVLAL